MAKKTLRPIRLPAPETVDTEPIELSAKVRRLVDTLRPSFRAFVVSFADLTASRAELAPTFMKTFGTFQSETGQTFVDFVRLLDPSVGPSRADYRQHRAYQAADYLRRLQAQQARPKTPSRSTAAPATPLDGMARLIASLLPLIGADQVPRLWEAVERELHWTDRQATALQHRVEQATPLVAVRPPRGVATPQLRIAPGPAHETDVETEPRTGTRG